MNEFYNIIKDIINTPNFKSMKKYRHHKNISTYRHSILVAYMCYLKYKKNKKKWDLNTLIRGALLHDYYLYDWHNSGEHHRLHGFFHPKRSLKNAMKDYDNINKYERDMILHHMWPLTIIPPHTKYGWLLTLIDKKATIYDYFKYKKRKK